MALTEPIKISLLCMFIRRDRHLIKTQFNHSKVYKLMKNGQKHLK